jgi:hypothetical protein
MKDHKSLKTQALLDLLFVVVQLLAACGQGGGPNSGSTWTKIGDEAFTIIKTTGGDIFISKNSFVNDGNDEALLSVSQMLTQLPAAQLAPITWVASNTSDESTMKQLLQQGGQPVGDGVLVDPSLPIQDGLMQGVGSQIVFPSVLTTAEQSSWGQVAGSAQAAQTFGLAYDQWLTDSGKDLSNAVSTAYSGNPVSLEEVLDVAALFYNNSTEYGQKQAISFFVELGTSPVVQIKEGISNVTFTSSTLSLATYFLNGANYNGCTFDLDPTGKLITGVHGQPAFAEAVPIPTVFTDLVPKSAS